MPRCAQNAADDKSSSDDVPAPDAADEKSEFDQCPTQPTVAVTVRAPLH